MSRPWRHLHSYIIIHTKARRSYLPWSTPPSCLLVSCPHRALPVEQVTHISRLHMNTYMFKVKCNYLRQWHIREEYVASYSFTCFLKVTYLTLLRPTRAGLSLIFFFHLGYTKGLVLQDIDCDFDQGGANLTCASWLGLTGIWRQQMLLLDRLVWWTKSSGELRKKVRMLSRDMVAPSLITNSIHSWLPPCFLQHVLVV